MHELPAFVHLNSDSRQYLASWSTSVLVHISVVPNGHPFCLEFGDKVKAIGLTPVLFVVGSSESAQDFRVVKVNKVYIKWNSADLQWY